MQRHIDENLKQKTDTKRFEGLTNVDKSKHFEGQYNQLSQKTQKMVGKFKHWVSEALSRAPFVSVVKRTYEGIQQKDVTGRKLTKTEVFTRLASSTCRAGGHAFYLTYPIHQDEMAVFAGFIVFNAALGNAIHAWENYKFNDHLFDDENVDKNEKSSKNNQNILPQKPTQGAVIKTLRDYHENHTENG